MEYSLISCNKFSLNVWEAITCLKKKLQLSNTI